MPLGIDPLVDYVFKKLFADPANSDVLIHLLNAVLCFAKPIVSVEIQNPFNDKDFEDDKLSVLDIKARCSDGRWYNIEVQRRADHSFRSRLAYYGAVLYTGQLFEGEDYSSLTPAISICFLAEPYFRESKVPHLKFTLSDPRHQVELTERLQVHTIELAKYNFVFVEEQLNASDELTRWSFFLREAADLDADELRRLLPTPEFVKATGVVEMIARTPEERMQYESRRKAEWDRNSQLSVARREGIEFGREEGLELGRTVGVTTTLVQQIQKFQLLLDIPQSPESELLKMPLADLTRLSDELFAQLQSQKS